MQHGRVITFVLRQLKQHEVNYLVHDLELAIIVFGFRVWRHYLYESQVQIFINHEVSNVVERVKYMTKIVDKLNQRL